MGKLIKMTLRGGGIFPVKRLNNVRITDVAPVSQPLSSSYPNIGSKMNFDQRENLISLGSIERGKRGSHLLRSQSETLQPYHVSRRVPVRC